VLSDSSEGAVEVAPPPAGAAPAAGTDLI